MIDLLSPGQFYDEGVDLVFGPNIDAPSRLIEHQDVGVAHQPFGQNNFLLVAPTQVDDTVFGIIWPDLQPIEILLGDAGFLSKVQKWMRNLVE